MTVDLRVPNASTKLTSWLMPNLQDKLHDLHGSEVFATLDFCQGYWQKPLHKDYQECQAAEQNNYQLYVVSKILDARYNEQEMFHELLVAWRGFPVGEATREPYSVMAVDIPDMVAKFMESHEDIDAVREMRSL
jgi:hypothetical protein